jgi:hypothetical protein
VSTQIRSKIPITAFSIFGFILALVALQSMHAWFLIGMSSALYAGLFAALILLLCTKGKRCEVKLFTSLACVLYALYSYRSIDFDSLNSILGNCIRVVIFSYIILLKNEFKAILFSHILNLFVFVVALGMPFYIFDLLTGLLPSFNLHVASINAYYSNHIFFISPQNNDGFYRYMGVFLEPGYLAMISALFLYPLQYDYKSIQGKILYIGALVSFSAAGYGLILVGYLLYLQSLSFIRNFGNTLFRYIGFIIAFAIVFMLVSSFEILAVVDKIQRIFEQGSMDSRLSSDFKRLYEAANLDVVMFGIGNQEYMDLFEKGGSAGWKVFIIKYGIVSLIALFSFYFLICLHSRDRRTFLMLVLFSISFTQRAYAMWEIQLLIFICGSAYLVMYRPKAV